jgi:hypothetical protein
VALSSGVWGLIGVVTGGAITGGVQWSVAARTDWLDGRVARRRVKFEMEAIRSGLVPLVDDTEAALRNRDDLDLVLNQDPMFLEHGDRLARHVSEATWEAVTAAYRDAKFLLVLHDESTLPEAARVALEAVDAAIARLR